MSITFPGKVKRLPGLASVTIPVKQDLWHTVSVAKGFLWGVMSMLSAFLASLMLVLLAEMGDKTQLLAMAFAARYKPTKVLIGVFIATLLNHALAVAAGCFFSMVIPMDIISLVANLSFVLFGLWTIRGDFLGGEDRKVSRFGPIVTVAIGFFIAELGDKTQLATISLAVKYQSVFAVLMGTTVAMVIADSIAIVIAVVLGKTLPEKLIKTASAGIFILFGFYGVYNVLARLLSLLYQVSILGLLAVSTVGAGYYLVGKYRKTDALKVESEKKVNL